MCTVGLLQHRHLPIDRRGRSGVPPALVPYLPLIAIRFTFSCALADFGKVTVSTPLLNEASTLSASIRTRGRREQYMPLVGFCLRRSSADFIICMCEFDFRRAQV